MMDTKEVLLLWFISFLIKKSAGSGIAKNNNSNNNNNNNINNINNNNNNNNDIKQNLQLDEELHKPMIRKFKKRKFILDLNIIFGVLI